MKVNNTKKEGENSQKNDYKLLEQKIEELALALDKVEDEKLEIQNQLKKSLADYHNLLSNSEKRETLRIFQMKKSLLKEVIPSLDSMMMAVESSKDISLDESGKSWLEGIIATIESIYKSFSAMGLKQYVPEKNSDFDNQRHEAIATVESKEKGKIVDIIQPGYVLDDTVIRPARVVVSK